MTIIINPGPRLHKHIGNNVCTTIHKNLIKILTERTKKHAAFSKRLKLQNTERGEKWRCRRGF